MNPWPLHRCAEALVSSRKELLEAKRRLIQIERQQEDLELEKKKTQRLIFNAESSMKHWMDEIEASLKRLEVMK